MPPYRSSLATENVEGVRETFARAARHEATAVASFYTDEFALATGPTLASTAGSPSSAQRVMPPLIDASF